MTNDFETRQNLKETDLRIGESRSAIVEIKELLAHEKNELTKLSNYRFLLMAQLNKN